MPPRNSTPNAVTATTVFMVPLGWWQKGAPWIFAASFVLLVLVLIPGIGREVNGARRWLNLMVVTVQPSELMKLAVVLYAADYTVRKHAVLLSPACASFDMFRDYKQRGDAFAAAVRAL